MAQPGRDICYFGTTDAAAAPRELSAGPVTAELEGGAVRHIKYRGIEVLRGIAFLVRDVNWGTFGPVISDLNITEADDGFVVTYRARCSDARQAFTYGAKITGTADGGLTFEAEGASETGIDTNRLGFVVLHPLVGVAGQGLTVTHTDGATEETIFPHNVSPSQPVFDIRALAHQVCPGVTATCTMTGDAYEMEDQRNWTDASYKTYVRPLARPLPYTVPAGEVVRQSIELKFAGQPGGSVGAGDNGRVSVTVGALSGSNMPEIGLAVDEGNAEQALAAADRVAGTGVQLLVCQLDLRRPDRAALGACATLAGRLGARVMLELIVADDTNPVEAAATAADAAASAGLDLESVAVSPAAYLSSYQPDAVWPEVAPLSAYYDAVRGAFPGALVGGGMFSYFTELNRKRPPADAIDYVTHTTCPIVHDADDRSVMETLEALPYVISSTGGFMGDLPIRVGPSSIGMRQNPYGAGPAANPDNIRVAMAQHDPRHRGLFGAAWAVGYAAEMARGGVGALTLAAAGGLSGIAHNQGDRPVPYFDDEPASGELVYPIYQVIRGLAAAAGCATREIAISDRGRVQAFAFDTPRGIELWLANLFPSKVEIALQGVAGGLSHRHLDVETFEHATVDYERFWTDGRPLQGSVVELDAFAVARITPN